MPSALFQIPIIGRIRTLAYGVSFEAATAASPAIELRGVTRGRRVGRDSSSSNALSISGSPAYKVSLVEDAGTAEVSQSQQYLDHAEINLSIE